MNFLAHLYLAGESNDLKIGGAIADWVKGKNIYTFSPEIQKGIILHRDIDEFTDKHEIFIYCKSYFKSKYDKYSGVVIDIVFDHFLSYNWSNFSKCDKDIYISDFYELLRPHIKNLPEQAQFYFPRMIQNNWLKMYESIDGLEKVLIGMGNRTSMPKEAEFAINQIQLNYDDINSNFLEFFKEIKIYIGEKYCIEY